LFFRIYVRLREESETENWGGARLDWKATNKFENRVMRTVGDSGLANTGWKLDQKPTWAHCRTVNGRQQSWLQQLAGALNWDSCVASACRGFRMQQAWGAGAEIASASGVKILARKKISSNLAV